MAGLSQRELVERCKRQHGRSRVAPSAAEAQSVCNRGFEPLVRPSCQKEVLAREAKQGQARLVRCPSSCTEDLVNSSVSVQPVLDRDSLPASISQDGKVGP